MAWRFCKVAVGGKIKDDVLTGAKYGFIDKSGAETIKPEYDMIGQFSGSVALVKKKINTDISTQSAGLSFLANSTESVRPTSADGYG